MILGFYIQGGISTLRACGWCYDVCHTTNGASVDMLECKILWVYK